MNTAFIKALSVDQLKELATVVNNELHAKNPENIARQKQEQKWAVERMIKNTIKRTVNERMRDNLKKILVPGTRLKMKGCKDGHGLREFIKWDENGNLVCWQIVRRRRFVGRPSGGILTDNEATNVVTTHMPDKVSKVFTSNGEVTAKQLGA